MTGTTGAPQPAGVGTGVCPLCGGPVTATAERCPDCGCSLLGVDGRPGPFSRRTLWWWAGALLAIYLVVLAVVVATS
jgi:hypothetical protein